MTDSEKELVKQLRRMHEYTGLPSYNNAADAIERLVKERDFERGSADRAVRERDEARAEVQRLNGLLLAPIRAALEAKHD